MHTIYARNVNEALAQGIKDIIRYGDRETSRNGDVLVMPEPVMTVYTKPTERVLFSPVRDANPFFHLMEALWMLDGRDDVEFPSRFNSKFIQYSDDGIRVHGAYGYRWRVSFGFDQLDSIAAELTKRPNSRRAVLQMWHSAGDLTSVTLTNVDTGESVTMGGLESKDIPCNTHVYFDVRNGELNMTVCCRSNDILWGAYGANAVHFSILQEYLAKWIGVNVGLYRQFSNNYHMYLDLYGFSLDKLNKIADDVESTNLYSDNIKPYPLISTSIEIWNKDLRKFLKQTVNDTNYEDPFFYEIAAPMYKAYMERKNNAGNGLSHIETMFPCDWKLACTQWICNREKGKH